jgi:hypothetical protein
VLRAEEREDCCAKEATTMGNSDSKKAEGEDESTAVTGLPGTDGGVEDSSRRSPSKSRRSRRNGKSDVKSKKKAGDGETPVPKKITDDQIQVNLAMADLMAYLQVVANNSNHLPLTRRDDPEVVKVVTTLGSEEYARKSAAFVPADIRVIGGTFTRYGRVWDLPTSEVGTNDRCVCVSRYFVVDLHCVS